MAIQNEKLLKETHPQKYYLKLLCKYIYIMGLGDFWYEKTERSRSHRILYVIWAIILNGYLILNTLNEVLANFRTDLNFKERNDLIQFSFAHPCLCCKFFVLIFQKVHVRALFKRMMEDTRSVYTSLEADKSSVKKAFIYVTWLAIVTYGAVFLALMDGIRAYVSTGIPIRTEVLLYPTRNNSGLIVNILRFLTEAHWWVIVTNMIVVDGLVIFSLTFLGSKFKTVIMYFQDLQKRTVKNVGTKEKKLLLEEFEKDFKTGVVLHEDALWCAKNVQYTLGTIYSLEVFENITLVVICLIRLVTTERNLIFLLSILAYIACLFVLTGAYFTAAGDTTYQASKVCISMFHCGWELLPANRSLRAIAVVAIQRSQVPVYMTAFGVIILSHSNFISVMRSSYSFFAVMY